MDGSVFIGTAWALLPPLLAIVLALVTKEVYSSLFVGVALGALLCTGFHPWNAFVTLFDIRSFVNFTADSMAKPCGKGISIACLMDDISGCPVDIRNIST